MTELAQRIRAASPPARGVRIWGLGQAGFACKTAERTVLIDPFLSDWIASPENPDPGRRARPSPLDPEEVALAQVVFSTHEHIDHLDPGTVPLLAGPGMPLLVVPSGCAARAEQLGVPTERIVAVEADVPAEVAGIRVTAIPAAHAFAPGSFGGYTFWVDDAGRHHAVGYLLELGGVRLFHGGDGVYWTGLDERLRDLRPDVVILPINGRDWRREAANLVGNLLPREAADLAVAAGARLVIPCHYDGIVGNTVNPGEFVEYLSANHPGQAFRVLTGDEDVTVEP